MVNLPGDLLLLTIKPDGGWLGGGLGPDEAMGAAALSQLVLDGALTIRDKHIGSVDAARVPAELAPLVPEGGALAEAAEALGPVAKERGLADLERRGVIEIKRKKVLGLLPTVTMTVLDGGPRSAVLERVEGLVDGRDVAEPEATALIVAILDATGHLPFLMTVPPERLQQIVGGAGTSEGAVLDDARASIEQLRVAVYTSVILPTTFPRG